LKGISSGPQINFNFIFKKSNFRGTDSFTVTILNGNSKQFSGYIRIPVNNQNIKILSNNGQQIDFRVFLLILKFFFNFLVNSFIYITISKNKSIQI